MNININNVKTLIFENNKFTVKDCNIYIKDDKIVSISEKPEYFIADKTINGNHKLAIPGLINTHTHAYMSIFRNIADDLSFEDWLFKTIDPLEGKLIDSDFYWGSQLSIIEMIKTGTTCFLDMNMGFRPTYEAVCDAKIRAVLSRGLVGEGDNEAGKIRLKEFFEVYNSNESDKVTFLLGPHAPYTCDNAFLEKVVGLAKENEIGITIHLSESLFEVESAKSQYNMSQIEIMEKIGLFDVPTIAAHCVQLSDNDIDILAKHNVTVATNPKSNLKLANGIAPLYKMQQKGVNITIGTDGQASNNTVNMFSEMNYVGLLHKGTNHNPTVISANDCIKFATLNASKALNIPNIGTIEVGNKADIVLLDTDCPQFQPSNNLISALVYSANGYETDTVIVDGEILMENKELKTIDTEKVYFECNNIINRITK